LELSQTAPIPSMLIWRRIPAVLALALTVNLLLLGLGLLLSADLRLPDGAGAPTADNVSDDLVWLQVIVVTALSVLIAGGLFSWLLRWGPRGVLWFNLGITVIAGLSLIGPLTLPIGWGARLLLAAMHLVVWAACFFGLGRSVLR
jgi:uncharacterized BrkB/YihY/UPF0761 family membrane protein